jgi:hypothetical protein
MRMVKLGVAAGVAFWLAQSAAGVAQDAARIAAGEEA